MTQDTGKLCEQCGSAFKKDPRYTWAYFTKQKFCSRDCSSQSWSDRRLLARQDLATTFEKWFAKADGCWEWSGGIGKDGYARFNYAGKQHRAARIALQLAGVEMGGDMLACHHCDNPRCVRPDHLFAGTQKDNMRDMSAKGRHWRAGGAK